MLNILNYILAISAIALFWVGFYLVCIDSAPKYSKAYLISSIVVIISWAVLSVLQIKGILPPLGD